MKSGKPVGSRKEQFDRIRYGFLVWPIIRQKKLLVANPGFAKRGTPTQRWGAIILVNFSRKLHEKENSKNWIERKPRISGSANDHGYQNYTYGFRPYGRELLYVSMRIALSFC